MSKERSFHIDGQKFSNNGGGNVFTPAGKSSYPTSGSRGGDGGRSGEGGSGLQSGGVGHQLHPGGVGHQLHPRDAQPLIELIEASESEIQKLVNQYRPLNPQGSEESLRSAAICVLGIATVDEQEGLKNYKREQERALQASIDEKLRSDTIQALKLAQVAEHDALHKPALREWSLGIDTASSNGRTGKAADFINKQMVNGLSNHMITCLQHLKINGGVNELKVISFAHCDLAERDMVYFTAKTESYPLSLNYLDFSYNKIGVIGAMNLFTGFFHLHASVRYPAHNVISLNLSENSIGDGAIGVISNYIRDGYVSHLKVLNLADNNITDKGAVRLAHSLISPKSDLKVLHLEGNKLTSAGEGYLVKALLNKATQHMIIYTQSYKSQFDDNVKMIFGTRQEKAAVFKKFIAQGVEKGVNAKEIVVDQTLWGEIVNAKSLVSTSKQTFLGFIKCYFDPMDIVKGYAGNKIIAKLPKSIGRLAEEMKEADDVVTCYFEAHNEAWTSEAGVNVLTHELCITGESEFCNAP